MLFIMLRLPCIPSVCSQNYIFKINENTFHWIPLDAGFEGPPTVSRPAHLCQWPYTEPSSTAFCLSISFQEDTAGEILNIGTSCFIKSNIDHVSEIINKTSKHEWLYCEINDSMEMGNHPYLTWLILKQVCNLYFIWRLYAKPT